MQRDLEKRILLMAKRTEGNPLGDVPEGVEHVPASQFLAWSVWFWEQLGEAFAGEDLSFNLDVYCDAITNSSDNPLKQLSDDAEIGPLPIVEQTIAWMAKAIAANIESTTASRRP